MEHDFLYEIISFHFPNEKIKNIRLPSKSGCDNLIYLIEFDSGTKIVFRQPLKVDSSKSITNFPMHRPGHQAWALELLKDQQLTPKLLALNIEKNYLIESSISGHHLTEYSLEICRELGEFLYKLHSIKMKQFGYMSETPSVGIYSSWLEMFEKEFNNLNENQSQFKDLYLSMKSYLSSFNNPVLVHGDISSENIFILNEHLNGVIDYADCLCGDGLYDIGRFFLFAKGDWKYVDALAQGYKLFDENKSWTKIERQCIQFYACYFALWLETDNELVDKLLIPISD